MPVFDTKGKVVALGKELGRGGEGSVFTLDSTYANLVAKIYHKPVDVEKSAKLATMARLGNTRLTQLAAWPMETLHIAPGGAITGLLMPKVSGKEVHLLYSPKSRQTHFPSANWPFLIHTSANVARAVAVIHEHGHVIGDINHGNLFVSDQATVMLIDCDSFQVASQGHHYCCEVGVDTYTPPELQGKSFKNVIRTTNHDNFGLAVLIFHLLFMGRHPFAGRYLGPEAQPPLERLIADYRFAYGSQASARQMQTPPSTLPLAASGSTISSFFERAFSAPSSRLGLRPTAQEWIVALTSLAKQLKVCSLNATHHYLSSLSTCPWCDIEKKNGITLFGLIALNGAKVSDSTVFNLVKVWAYIESVTAPISPAPPKFPSSYWSTTKPSPHVAETNSSYWPEEVTDGGIFSAMTNWFGRNKRRAEAKRRFDEATIKYKQHVNAKTAMWQSVYTAWNDSTETKQFDRCLSQLKETRWQHERLTQQKDRQILNLKNSIRERQLTHYLDAHELRHARLHGIGQSRKATLQSYGIETAADISPSALSNVPGFGPAMAGTLLAWRKSVEAGFVFNPTKAINQADVTAIENAIAVKQQPLEKELMTGGVRLEHAKAVIIARRQELLPRLEEAARAVAQAEVDLQALRFENK